MIWLVIYKKIYTDEPNRTHGTMQLIFPHIDKIAPDEQSRKQLEGRLREQTNDIILKYNVLKHKLFDKLEDENYSIPKLERYLKDYGGSNFASIKDVQDFITKR